MDTILDRLRRARYISKIDLKSAYHQVCLDDDSKAYTAFSVQGSGQYQFLRLPFGLKCAPMTFQRLMDSLFGAEVEPYVFAYLDDIILVTETFEEHVSWLERVIRILLDAKLVVNRDKCEFVVKVYKFLGYVLDSSGLRIDSERVRPIHDYPTPRNVKQVRRLLGMRSYNALLDPVSNAENSWRLVVPAEQRERVLTESHCLTSSGHLGARKTYDRLACEYWWPGMWYAVEEYCNSCDVCQRYKVPQTGPKGLMTRRVVDRPWAVVAADMMEFPRSKNQNKYLLVFQDLFTRWIEIVPLRKANGVNVLRAFEELVLFRWETPEFLLTDNGKEFDNAVMERNTNEEQRRSFAAVVRGATGRTAPSVRRRWTSERGRRAPRENASEEARASQEAVAELNEYVRLMELGVPARLRPEPEGRAVVEVSGELIPVFARPSMHASEDAMDWEESVQPGNYSWQRPAWQQRTDADRRRASRQRRQASGVGTRQRTPSPGEGRRPNGGGEPLLEEETRAMLEQLVAAARQPVEEWDGEAFEEVFRGSPEEEVLLLEEGEATATLRRSGETTEESARVPTPPLAPVQEPSALPLPPPVQQVSYVAGDCMAWCSSRSPCNSSACHRRSIPSTGNNSASFAARGLPRAATTSSATSTATATTSARGSPRGGSTSKPGGGS
ncbi:unnamed protein product [Trichogramma brassicae]|uniref:RNA-directed DNA polymerase n=1 Tax=Trichogramma brassicae TaxID=86971 RepID=A0A6H5I941_9HYME|nr:unnamed protein product [Trichogramma brassicae]